MLWRHAVHDPDLHAATYFVTPHTPMRRAHAWLVLGAFLGLAVVWTWPLARHLSSRVPHDPGDPLLNIWLVWWNAHAIPFTDRWWNPPFFVPMPGALALSEHLAGLGVITTPLQLGGAGALTAYNVALMLSFALSGYFAFLLVRRMTGSVAAGVCAGLAFGCAPYRAGQLAHLQVLTSQWMPLALLSLHAYAESGRRRWLFLFSAAWLIQALSNGYYLLFFPVLIVLWLGWFVDWRAAPGRGIAIVATWCLSSLLLLPGLLEYARVQRGLGLARSPGEMFVFSAKPSSFFNTPGMLAWWPFVPAETEELYLFPGITAILLVTAALIAGWRNPRAGLRTGTGRSPLLFYIGAALVMWTLALGPAPPGSGFTALFRPYTLLTYLPGFEGLRVPARFAMLGALCLAIAAGLAVARLASGRLFARRSVRFASLAFVLAGLTLDGWTRPMPLIAPPGRIILPAANEAAVVELPLNEGIVNTAALFRAMAHGRTLVNGYSGHTPPHYAVLTTALGRGDSSVIAELARGRPLIILVNDRMDSAGDLRRMVEALPGVQGQGGSSAGSMFLLPALPRRRTPPTGTPFPASVGEIDRNRAEVDLGSVRIVRTVEFPLRWHAAELDPRIAVEASVDRERWTIVWEDWTGGAALAGTLEDPRLAPVRMIVPDVSARYLRIHPAPKWLWRELKVYGP